MASIVPAPNNYLEHRVAALEQQLREMQRGTLYSAAISDGGLDIRGTGGLSVHDSEGNETFFVGAKTGHLARPDGSPQPVFVASDDNGRWRIALWDPDPLDQGYQQAFYTWDHEGRIAFTTDINGGVAEPWIPVPMSQTFYDNAFPNNLSTFQTIPVSAAGGGIAWEGRIGKVSHPRFQIDGVWGRPVGTSAVPNYTVSLGSQVIGTWSQTDYQYRLQGPWDITDFHGQTNVRITLTVSATGTATDRVACHVLAAYMRQT